VAAFLEEAGSVMPESIQARRSLIFQNPDLQRGTSHTINMGVQMILPGETAWAHRHSIAALRFVIQGSSDLYTIVNGVHCELEENDLVLTPNWAWHDHHNNSKAPTYWLDVLDVPLVLALNQTFYEPATGPDQPLPEQPTAPVVLRYPWRDVGRALANAPINAIEGRLYDYLNPLGGPTLPTLQCRVQCLPAGFTTASRRRTSSAVYHVVKGKGVTHVAGLELHWSARDCFVVPNWAPHHHANLSCEDDAVLFSVHDTPVLQALGLYRDTKI
jgi:1-hydroxy-2-naphthoate dioxygenase